MKSVAPTYWFMVATFHEKFASLNFLEQRSQRAELIFAQPTSIKINQKVKMKWRFLILLCAVVFALCLLVAAMPSPW